VTRPKQFRHATIIASSYSSSRARQSGGAMKQYRPLVIAACVAACATAAAAQSEQGRLIGSVRDASNAFVGGATVTIRNERTSDARTTETDPQGKFFVGSLKPSTYTVKVAKPG